MIFVEPPFELGETLVGSSSGTGGGAADTLRNNHWLGQVFFFPAKGASGASSIRGNKARPIGKGIYAVVLRNESGITLLGKRIALLTETAGYSLVSSVNGYAGAGYGKRNCVFIDPYLPSTGVVDDDLFWGIIGGPTTCLLPTAGADFGTTSIAVGDFLVNSTGTTTGATTSGRVAGVTATNATAAQNALEVGYAILGRALSAATSNQTTAGQELLIDACIRWK